MKKVLALVLAVMMMATVAFAAGTPIGTGSSSGATKIVPGSKIKLQDSGNELVFDKSYTSVSGTVEYKDGTIKLAKKINTENYTVTSVKYNEGKSLIESVKIVDADDQVVIKLKDDYSNTKEKDFDIEFTLKGKGKYTKPDGKKVSTPDLDVRVTGTVGYAKKYLVVRNNDDDVEAPADLYDDDKGTTPTSPAIASGDIGDYIIEVNGVGGATYGNLTQEIAGDEVNFEVRVYDGNKFNLGWNTDVNKDVVKANPDAEMTFYEWDAAPTFDATAKIYFNDADEDHFVYQIKDGKVTEVGKYDEDEGCWVVKARTLGAYVVSDTKLASASTATGTNNPDTGANDVVGIATALAAVALVSAAAVSLKK